MISINVEIQFSAMQRTARVSGRLRRKRLLRRLRLRSGGDPAVPALSLQQVTAQDTL